MINPRVGVATSSKSDLTIVSLVCPPLTCVDKGERDMLVNKKRRFNLAIYSITLGYEKDHQVEDQIKTQGRFVLHDPSMTYTALGSCQIPMGVSLCALKFTRPTAEVFKVYTFGGDPRWKTFQGKLHRNKADVSCFFHHKTSEFQKVFCFERHNADELSCVGQLYHGRINATCIALPQGKQIAVLGGDRTGTAVEYFDVETQMSSVGLPLMECRYSAGAVALYDDPFTDVLVAGGLTSAFHGTALRSVECVSPKDYYDSGALISARESCLSYRSQRNSTCLFSGSMTARPAVGCRSNASSFLCSSTSPNTPSRFLSLLKRDVPPLTRHLASMNQARASFGIVKIPQTSWALVVGGFNGVRGLASTELYHVELDFWIEGPALNSSRVCPFVWVGDNLNVYVFGGMDHESQKYVATMEVWNALPLKSKTFHYKKKIGRFSLVSNCTVPFIPFSSVIVSVFSRPTSTLAMKPSTLYNIKIPKLQLQSHQPCDMKIRDEDRNDENTERDDEDQNSHDKRPTSQFSLCSTMADSRYSFDTLPDLSPRLRCNTLVQDKGFSLEAPRHGVESYFHSTLVSKMRQRKTLKSFLWR